MSEKEIKKKVEGRVGETSAGDETPAEDNSITPRFIDQCFGDNVMGDAYLFARVCSDRFLFNGNSGMWFRWNKHYWEEDLSNSILGTIGNDMADLYNDRADEIKEDIAKLEAKDTSKETITIVKERQKNVNKRAFALRGDRAPKVLKWIPAIAPKMVVEHDDLDKENHLLVCQNGVINLETGECNNGDPADKLTFSLPHDWQGLDADPEELIKALRCSLEAPYDYAGDKEKFLEDRYEYIHRFIGMSAHGAQNERAFMVLFGKHGWNGKGTLMETLLYVLGDYAAPTEPEVLLDSKGGKEAGKPTPHILAMKGCRILVASETDDGNRFSAAAVKRYSGGDTLRGRNPHDKRNTDFKPTHILYLMTNNLPYTDANDRPFWNRLHLLNFHWSYVDKPIEKFEKPRNPRLEAELRKEAPQILAWIVKGYFKYLKEGGLNPPEEMLKERETYRFRDDTIGQFAAACCKEDPDKTVATSFKDIRERFDLWYLDNISKKPMSVKMLGTLLGKKYNKVSTKGNFSAYEGIELKETGLYVDD